LGYFLEAAGQIVALPRHLSQPALQVDDAADGGERHAFIRHGDDLLDHADLDPGVAALSAGGSLRRDNTQLIAATQERLLDRKELGDLTDRVQRNVLVFQRSCHLVSSPSR